MLTRRNRIGFGVAAITAAAGSVLSAAPVSAAPPTYTHVVANFAFQPYHSHASGYVDCPPGKLAIASGAVSADPRASLLAHTTTPAHTGAFASAWGGSNSEAFQVKAQCVDAGKLAGFTNASLTVRDHTGQIHQPYVRKVTCPTGTVAYGGGGTVYNGSVFDQDGLYIYGSKPDGASWSFAGFGTLGTRSLGVETHCLPRARLGKIVTVEQTVTSPDQTIPGSGTRRPVFVGARCPAGFAAFAGGAWYHPIGSTTPSWDGYLRVSEMSADERGWFAGGDAFKPNTQLTTKVRCTDRLG
jgi:hypothetical protein